MWTRLLLFAWTTIPLLIDGRSVMAQTTDGALQPTLEVAWSVALQQDGLNHVFDRIAFSESEGKLLAVKKTCSKSFHNGRLALWEITPDGRVVDRFLLNEHPQEAAMPRVPGRIAAIISHRDGGLVLVGRIDSSQTTSVMKLDVERKIVWTTPIPELTKYGAILKAVPGPNESILAVGESPQKGVAICMDIEGNLLWARTYQRDEPHQRICDIVVSLHGRSLLLIGDTGNINKFGLGPSKVWLIQCDAAGRKTNEEVFPGRMPRACGPMRENRVVVLYDTSTGMPADNVLAAYDTQLHRLWTKPADLAEVWVYQPSIVRISPTRFAVAARAGRELRIREYDTTGRVLRSLDQPIVPPSFVQLVAWKNRLAVNASTTYDGDKLSSGTIISCKDVRK
jgi:hypothetical protein